MNADSFKKIFLPHHQNFYRVAYRLLESREDAEDVVQDAFVKLWNARDTLGYIRNAEAYGVAIVKNICFDKLRSAEHKAIKCDFQETLKYEITDASDRMDTSSGIILVRKITQQLPEKQQIIFDLRYFKDCTFEEIEQITGMSAVYVRVLLTRARRSVKEQFNKVNYYEKR